MNPANENISPDRVVDRQAAEWVVRQQQGLDATGRREFQAWLQDPAHAAAFAEMRQTSELLDGLRDSAPLAAARPPRARLYWFTVGAAAAAAIVMLALFRLAPSRSVAPAAVQVVATDVGVFKELPLADGSVVGLNTDTAVEVRYSPTERRIALVRGEAFFTVAKNPARPFFVEAGGVAVRAVGTAFNVRYRADGIEVTVREGKVQVSRGSAGVVVPSLVAGERTLILLGNERASEAIAVARLEEPRLQSALAWREHRLEFSDTPLGDVAAEFNRYNRHRLVIEDPALAEQKFGGAFAASGYESLIEVLEQSFGVVAERRADVTILRRAR